MSVESSYRICYHDNADDCPCRKPKPGLLLQAAQDWNIDLSASFIVGDRWKDIEAGRRAGCRTILTDYGYAEKEVDQLDCQAGSLFEAVDWILQHHVPHKGEGEQGWRSGDDESARSEL